jgi:hypothetical protein
LSAALNEETKWNYRKTDQRLIVVKTKNENIRKVAVLDVLTNVPFTITLAESMSMEDLQPEKEYLAHLKVYTSKNLEGIKEDFINFFDAVDVDQDMQDFIKAYWVYPSKISFELADFEEP